MIVAPPSASGAAPRRGISLVELLVVLSGCSVVLSTTGVLLHRAMRSETETRRMFDIERAALRLSNQFRSDVHNAIEVEVPARSSDCELLRMTFHGGQSVRYARAKDAVIRVRYEGDKSLGREEYRLGATDDMTVAEETEPRRISITINSRVAPSRDEEPHPRASAIRLAPVSLQLIAVAGRNAPFVPPTAAEQKP